MKPSAAKELDALPDKVRRRVAARIKRLAEQPRPHGCEKLSDSKDQYRVRQGEYRILYEIADSVLLVYVVKIDHRRDVYRG